MKRCGRLLGGTLALALGMALLTGAGPGWSNDAAPRRGELTERWRDATPEQRRRMRAAAVERWERATPRERQVVRRQMMALRRALPDFSRIERRALLRRSLELPRTERRALWERILRIDDLDPEARKALVAELKAMIEAEGETIERTERNAQRWQKLSEAEREEYRAQMRRWREMSVEDRRIILDDWSDEEREAGAPKGEKK